MNYNILPLCSLYFILSSVTLLRSFSCKNIEAFIFQTIAFVEQYI